MTTKTATLTVKKYTNASAANFGPFDSWRDYRFADPDTGFEFPGKVWIKDLLGLTGTEVSFGSIPVGGSVPFEHTHEQNEELYIFLVGQGQMRIDSETIEVSAGSTVRVDPVGIRCWRNTGEADLVYIVIQSKAGSLEQWTGDDGTVTSHEPTWN